MDLMRISLRSISIHLNPQGCILVFNFCIIELQVIDLLTHLEIGIPKYMKEVQSRITLIPKMQAISINMQGLLFQLYRQDF